ncbi:acyl-ACP desaturase, partial [Actinosynnema sp. NPDC059797]
PWPAAPGEPEQSKVTDIGKIALVVNLLTEDNLPSYHHEIATRFGRDGAWGTWVARWTAEEGRHAMCIRDYLLTTRSLDPDALERGRMAVMQSGHRSDRLTPLESLVYVSFQELATRVAHRNTGHHIDEPVIRRLLRRVAADENLHMVFYRSLVAAALEIDPSAVVRAICSEVRNFAMPGTMIPGFTRKALLIAGAGIYDLRIHHDEVVLPLLRQWGVFDLTGLDAGAEAARDDLAGFLAGLDRAAGLQRERLNRVTARSAATAT